MSARRAAASADADSLKRRRLDEQHVTSEASFERLKIPYESINCSGAIREKGFGCIIYEEHGSCKQIGADREVGQRGSWPTRGCGPCWFCLEAFDGTPFFIARCKTNQGVYEVFGNFCSIPCMHATVRAGLFGTNAGHLSLCLQMIQQCAPHLFDEMGAIPVQRPLADRVDYGGACSLADWRHPPLPPVDTSRMPCIAPCLLAISRYTLGESECDVRDMVVDAIMSVRSSAKKTTTRCLNCGDFVTETFRAHIPIRRMPWASEFEVKLQFCDAACAHRYLVSQPVRNFATNALFVHYCQTNFPDFCDSFGRVALAPPLIDRVDFGGSTPVDQWYRSKYACKQIVGIMFPPFAPTLMAVGKRYFGDRDADPLATRASASVLIELLKTGEQVEEERERPNQSFVIDFPSMTNLTGGREQRTCVLPVGRPAFLSLATGRGAS
jgi:hypothetical protein